MDEEDHCMTLLCSFLNFLDNLIMVIGSNMKKLVLDEVVTALLLEEVIQKYFESTKEALDIHGILKEKVKKREKGRLKSRGKHKSTGKSKANCWNFGKVNHFRMDYKEDRNKNKNKMNYSNDESENIFSRVR